MTTAALRLLTIGDLADLPAPGWMVDGILPAGCFITLYGPSGAGKSFLALDWALCIAAGLPWYGCEVQQGAVVYIAAEGVAGLYKRVDAWLIARNQQPPDSIRFIGGAVNLLDNHELELAQAAIAKLPKPPAAIVVDTMARSMVGGDENAARDVGIFIANLDELARPYSAARLIVHHTGKSGDDERGSSALRGASDTMISLKPDNASLRLVCDKQKDAEEFDRWTLHLQPTAESCVIGCGTHSGAIGPAERNFLEAVSASFGTGWATATAMAQTFTGARATYYRLRKALIDGGYLEVEDDSRTPRCRITTIGQKRVSPSPNEFHETGRMSLSSHPSREGETGTHTETANGTNPVDEIQTAALLGQMFDGTEETGNGETAGSPVSSIGIAATAGTRRRGRQAVAR
jgi:hypothetical protein